MFRQGCVFAKQERNRVGAERFTAAGGKQRVTGLATAFLHPDAQARGRLSGERSYAVLAALAMTTHMRTGVQMDVLAIQPGQFRDRSPVCTATTSRVESRRPVHVERSAAASKASTSARVRKVTSARS